MTPLPIRSHLTTLVLLAFSAGTVTAEQPPATTKPAVSKRDETEARRLVILKEGDDGASVVALQRLLNARLDPSPQLSVDGDFGAATRAALLRFQQSKGLKATGTTDSSTWEALGPDPAPDAPPPSPEAVNSRTLNKRPADPLDGPPFVSTKSWVVLDGRTGVVLGGHNDSQPLEMASTTKVMTALLVVRYAKVHPGALDELVVFSETADHTAGSTSGIKAGESLAVGDLLYGLLLPSGNDASVALAEHFGGRIGQEGDDPVARFVVEMNRVAVELGLRETHFANTSGLPAAKHHASARDLAKLAREALTEPAFAQRVGTRVRGATLLGKDGGKRNVVWTNTNKLLATQGYDGVKTGTTGAAGSCLIASGHRGDDHLIVVALGSPTSEARDADVRNLFRWGWLKKGHLAP